MLKFKRISSIQNPLPADNFKKYKKKHTPNKLKARVKRRSFHAPNLIQLSSTLERPWSGVMSNVELNRLF